jgi:hypothetical protein
MILTSLDDVKVLGVDVSVLGKVEVLLCDENALCGDRVSACPCVQQSRENVQLCHSHGSSGRILTSEEVPKVNISRCLNMIAKMEWSNEAQAQGWIFRKCPHLGCAAGMTSAEED